MNGKLSNYQYSFVPFLSHAVFDKHMQSILPDIFSAIFVTTTLQNMAPVWIACILELSCGKHDMFKRYGYKKVNIWKKKGNRRGQKSYPDFNIQ